MVTLVSGLLSSPINVAPALLLTSWSEAFEIGSRRAALQLVEDAFLLLLVGSAYQ